MSTKRNLNIVELSRPDWWNIERPAIDASKEKLVIRKKLKVKKTEDLPELLTVREAAQRLRMSCDTVYRHSKSGKLGSVKDKSGRIFFRPEDIADFLNLDCAG
jgi:excisionase family DNA binding protein